MTQRPTAQCGTAVAQGKLKSDLTLEASNPLELALDTILKYFSYTNTCKCCISCTYEACRCNAGNQAYANVSDKNQKLFSFLSNPSILQKGMQFLFCSVIHPSPATLS